MSENVSADELKFIKDAASFFENPSVMMKSLSWMGRRLEDTQKLLPDKVRASVAQASHKAIEKALWVALKSVKKDQRSRQFAKALKKINSARPAQISFAAVTGAIGGLFGAASTLVELPVVTILLLRSICEVAQNFDFDLSDPQVALQCLYVFSLGTESKQDDSLNSSYYASRLAYAQTMRSASAFIAKSSLSEIMAAVRGGSAPALVKFVAQVAERFEIDLTKKVLAQGAPIAGALGGSLINSLFADYYLQCARYHFGLNRLEQERGYEHVRSIFESERAKFKA